MADEELIIFKLGVKREIKRSTRDFEEEELENWPSILVALNNAPDIQKAAIQFDQKVFSRSSTVANILEESINPLLARFQLHVRFSPLFEKNYFWDIVDKYAGRIIQTDFEMISPNMSNISQALTFDLKELHRSTNTQETHISLRSDKDSSLTLSRDDPFVSKAVDYSSEGGGNIIVKVNNLRKRIQTAEGVTEITVDQAEIAGDDPKVVVRIVKELLNG